MAALSVERPSRGNFPRKPSRVAMVSVFLAVDFFVWATQSRALPVEPCPYRSGEAVEGGEAAGSGVPMFFSSLLVCFPSILLILERWERIVHFGIITVFHMAYIGFCIYQPFSIPGSAVVCCKIKLLWTSENFCIWQGTC